MKDIVNNNTDAIKVFLNEYGIENIEAVRHINNFVFEAITPSSSIKIISEPLDDEQKYIKILSITINLKKSAIPQEEQNLLVYIARYEYKNVFNYLNTSSCKKIYSATDIKDFKSIIDSSISNDSAIQKYWNLDTAARESFMDIVHNIFCRTLI